jgi:tRNA(Ile)-lysidine synthase
LNRDRSRSLRCLHARSTDLALVDGTSDVDSRMSGIRRPRGSVSQAGLFAALPRWKAPARARALKPFDELLRRCTFDSAGTPVDCAFSGGPDSTALVALAHAHGCVVTAHHVDHNIRPESGQEADHAAVIANRIGVDFQLHVRHLETGPNLEARARSARREALPDGSLTGHTLDDQAETVLIRLLRGSGSDGLGAMRQGPNHPILALRRAETEAVCAALEIEPNHDRSNDTDDAWRNRIRRELLPLATDITDRDVTPILGRTASILQGESDFLDELAMLIDPTDAKAIAAAHPVLARRALRTWLTESGYPPDSASIERVLAVANGHATACELPGGRRVERSQQHFRIVAAER